MRGIVTIAGGLLSYLYGQWSDAMAALTFLVIFDYITGFFAAAAAGGLSYRVGLIGIARKCFIFVVVAIGHMVDRMLGDQSVVMQMCLYFYLANEIISILENGGKLGVPIPNAIKQAIAVFQDKGGSSQ